jgi:hypothetical protein
MALRHAARVRISTAAFALSGAPTQAAGPSLAPARSAASLTRAVDRWRVRRDNAGFRTQHRNPLP